MNTETEMTNILLLFLDCSDPLKMQMCHCSIKMNETDFQTLLNDLVVLDSNSRFYHTARASEKNIFLVTKLLAANK